MVLAVVFIVGESFCVSAAVRVSEAFVSAENREYIDDSDTVCLYHLNQSSGTRLIDDNSSGRPARDGLLATSIGIALPAWVNDGWSGRALHFVWDPHPPVSNAPTHNGAKLGGGSLFTDYSDYTIEMYVKWDYVFNSELGYLVSSAEHDFIRGFLYEHGSQAGTMGLSFGYRDGSAVYRTINTPDDKSLQAAKWYHIAATRSVDVKKVTWKFYVDNTLIGSDSRVGYWAENPNNVYLGSQGVNQSFGGDIDEVRFSKFARTGFAQPAAAIDSKP